MTPQWFGLLERIHGHVAVLGLAVLLHPVITLRRRGVVTPGAQLSADLGAILLVAPFALGWAIYGTYRGTVKRTLYLAHDAALWRFETKEHLAVFATALAIAGALTLRWAGRDPDGRRLAWTLLLCAWLCGVATAGIGIYVAAVGSPAW